MHNKNSEIQTLNTTQTCNIYTVNYTNIHYVFNLTLLNSVIAADL